MPFPLGQLKKFWPQILEPVGRVHFAGSFADNLPWGMDAATRSANRVAEAVEIEVDNRRRVERQHLRQQQPADNTETEWLTDL